MFHPSKLHFTLYTYILHSSKHDQNINHNPNSLTYLQFQPSIHCLPQPLSRSIPSQHFKFPLHRPRILPRFAATHPRPLSRSSDPKQRRRPHHRSRILRNIAATHHRRHSPSPPLDSSAAIAAARSSAVSPSASSVGPFSFVPFLHQNPNPKPNHREREEEEGDWEVCGSLSDLYGSNCRFPFTKLFQGRGAGFHHWWRRIDTPLPRLFSQYSYMNPQRNFWDQFLGSIRQSIMKILQKNNGALTNFEVLEFLRSQGATSDPLGCLGSVTASECKVFDYLVDSPACNQTKKDIDEFLKRSESFDLAKAEKLNIINLRPSTQAEIYPIIEYCDKRFASNEREGTSKVEELVQIVLEVLPPPPLKSEDEEETSNTEEQAEE